MTKIYAMPPVDGSILGIPNVVNWRDKLYNNAEEVFFGDDDINAEHIDRLLNILESKDISVTEQKKSEAIMMLSIAQLAVGLAKSEKRNKELEQRFRQLEKHLEWEEEKSIMSAQQGSNLA